jgi:hypothetical protein
MGTPCLYESHLRRSPCSYERARAAPAFRLVRDRAVSWQGGSAVAQDLELRALSTDLNRAQRPWSRPQNNRACLSHVYVDLHAACGTCGASQSMSTRMETAAAWRRPLDPPRRGSPLPGRSSKVAGLQPLLPGSSGTLLFEPSSLGTLDQIPGDPGPDPAWDSPVQQPQLRAVPSSPLPGRGLPNTQPSLAGVRVRVSPLNPNPAPSLIVDDQAAQAAPSIVLPAHVLPP